MSLDVWFRDDMRNALAALNEANSAAIAQLATEVEEWQHVKIYRDGYCDALRAVAIAFGIKLLPDVLNEAPLPLTAPEPLTDSLRLTRTWKEVIDEDELNSA